MKPPASDAEARLRSLEQQMAADKALRDQENAALRKRVEELEHALQESKKSGGDTSKLDDAIAELKVSMQALTDRQIGSQAPSGARTAYLDMSFDLLTAAGGSQANDSELDIVQPGGHDPNQRGFTIQNAEVNLQGAVDPNFRGDANIVWQIDKEGGTNVELEEAYLTTLTLPEDLQIKAGQFFTDFGRINRQHPHEWDFVDVPLVNARMFGADGLRGPGARASWLVPTPFFFELQTGLLNPRGETQTSFFSSPGVVGDSTFGATNAVAPATLGGRPFVNGEVKNFGDMVFTERADASFDLSDESTIVAGASALFGPNATGPNGETQIYGLDWFYKWKPVANDQGWPFVRVQNEFMWRRYRADQFSGDIDGDGIVDFFPRHTFQDQGTYAQLLYGFERPWVAGLRVDWVDGDGASTGGDGTLDRRWRVSPDLTYYPSEFSKLRIQANFDQVEQLGDRHFFSLWIQFEILFGAHGAHKF